MSLISILPDNILSKAQVSLLPNQPTGIFTQLSLWAQFPFL